MIIFLIFHVCLYSFKVEYQYSLLCFRILYNSIYIEREKSDGELSEKINLHWAFEQQK